MSSRTSFSFWLCVILCSASVLPIALASSPTCAEDESEVQSDGGNKRTFIEGDVMGGPVPTSKDTDADPGTADRGTMDGGGYSDDGGNSDTDTP
jgi:hypothetical protein